MHRIAVRENIAWPPSLLPLVPLLLCALLASCGDDDTTGPPPGPEPSDLPIETSAQLQACVSGSTPGGALVEICLPAVWNGELVVWAHGYTNPGPDRPPYTPLVLPADEASGFGVKDVVRQLGTQTTGFYGYAATSYRRNGLVAPEAVADLEETASWARAQLEGLALEHGLPVLPVTTLLVGASEGGLSTVLAVEQAAEATPFDGGLALCAPIGDFRRQIEWFGDFRVLFDYFFAGVMPGSAVEIPDEDSVVTDANWEATESAIRASLNSDPEVTAQFAAVTGVPYDVGDPETLRDATTQILRYSFMGTNDAADVLGGNPFHNLETVYEGSDGDAALNAGVARHEAEGAALATIEGTFQTSGMPRLPLVAMHTSRDPVTPMWHMDLYETKNAGAAEAVTAMRVDRFGHCGFSLPELVAGFSQLVLQVDDANLVTSAAVFPDAEMQREFLHLARRSGARPVVIAEPE
ncbi:MAG: hypothetical protein M8861_03185 [marine benthic group bacterium]|nr:hypothetical protein [Gemmatimonadota bacterium]